MDELKRYSKCNMIYSRSNFYKDRTSNDSYRPSCKICTNQYYYDNQDRIKEYQLKNHEKFITQQREYKNNRYKTDINYRLICNKRRRIHHALNGKSKSSPTKDILGIDIDLYRK